MHLRPRLVFERIKRNAVFCRQFSCADPAAYIFGSDGVPVYPLVNGESPLPCEDIEERSVQKGQTPLNTILSNH